MTKSTDYLNLLSALVENTENLRNSVLCLLKATPIPTKTVPFPNQSPATYAQHFIYIALEELGKFFLILNQYDNDLDDLDLYELGWYCHNKKIESLIKFVASIQAKTGKKPKWLDSIKEVSKKLRNFKEDNVYIDYKNGKILKPIPKRGNGSLQAMVNLLNNGIKLAKFTLDEFKKDDLKYKH
jgi:AbiV family abortive infection protein